MDSHHSQSAAIGRVLRIAGRIAGTTNARAVRVEHVITALWNDESRAYEILTQAGVTVENVAEHVGPELARHLEPSSDEAGRFADMLTTEAGDFSAAPSEEPADQPGIEQSPVLQQALSAARSLAAELGRHAQLGSEHLLLGLLECDEQLSQWLKDQQVSLTNLRQQVSGAQGFSDEPIAVDIALKPVVRPQRETVRVDRILDASANRCREGLRVVEDFVRFVLDDAHLSRLLKELRHDLAGTLALLPQERMLAARDTAGDVGTVIQTADEQHREHAIDVVRANCKRVQESLRTLEEYAKTVNADAAIRFEQQRYRFYTIEQALLQTFRSRERLQNSRLYLLVTDRLCDRGCGPVIREALKGGVDVVQLREKQMPDRRLLDLALSVREWTAAADALFIVNDRPDIAAACDADGVHLGQDDMEVRHARQIVGGEKLIGVSTHSIEEARRAVIDGADYLGVGPVFPSQTKEFDEFPGLAYVREAAGEISRPWFALGGINQSNIAEVVAAGAERVAVSSVISSADSPADAARALQAALASRS
jgi:thiamine-phosphate pyrophosphorylase